MLEFDHRPPRGPEDVKFSEAGEFALRDRHSGENAMDAYGHLALIDIVDAFGFSSSKEMSDEDRAKIKEVRAHVHDLADDILSGLSTTVYASWGGVAHPRPYSAASSKSIREFSRGLGTDWRLQQPGYKHEKLWPLIDKVAKAKEVTEVVA